jgi:hypothetical protein
MVQEEGETMTIVEPSLGEHGLPSEGVIEIRIRDLSQLFNSWDPSPFHQKELDPNAEDYIFGSALELSPTAPKALVVYLDRAAGGPDEGRLLEESIRVHFARRSQLLRWELRQLIRQGWISLGIGLAFLACCLIGGQFAIRWLGNTALATVIQESLLIGGWVAMWKPIEIFLYDWWPILGRRRLYDRLSHVPVCIVYTGKDIEEEI